VLQNAKHALALPFSDLSAVYILDGMPQERKDKAYLLFALNATAAPLPYGKQALTGVALEFKAGAQVEAQPAAAGNAVKARR
jgi:hypothetical protein